MRNKSIIILPDDVRKMSHKMVDELSSGKVVRGVGSGLAELDKVVNPLTPGRMMIIMGRPSNGKTSLMMHYSRRASMDRVRRDETSTSPPIVVTAEMAIEEIALREISHIIPVDSIRLERREGINWDVAHQAVEEIYERSPIVYIGHSIDGNSKRPRMSVEIITSAILEIIDHYGYPPELITVDYAQRLRLDKITRDRRGEVSEIVETVKDMALAFSAPVILGSQVGRQVDQKSPPVPDMSDAKETANLEETADTVLSVMRPSRYYKVGATIPGTSLDCHENLFYVYVVKQRQGLSSRGVWCWFDMSISRLTDLEIKTIDLNDY